MRPKAVPDSSAVPPFSDLLREHQAMVFSMAWHFFRNRATAEEIAQEVFLQLYRSLDDLESAEHAVYWLRRVTINRCISEARRQRLRIEVPLDAVPGRAVATQSGGDPWLRQRLRRLVGSLPPMARMVIILRYQEDLDPEEIAALLQIPVNTVKSKLHRALAILRQKAGANKVQL